jgi:hypothetical protein
MPAESVQQFITSDDPLSNAALQFIANYREEDLRIEFKETFNPNSEYDWLQITKDIMAYANTLGGYLIFGIQNATYIKVGLLPELVKIITDSNLIMQKVNRFMDPQISLLRSKEFSTENKQLVALFVPKSIRITHMISKDGSFMYPSGKEKMLLQKGTFYVRRSAGVHLADTRDLDDIMNRRIEEFRESLFRKIARVVEAPAESEVFVLSEETAGEPHKRFVIDDAPDSIPIKGMSFTIVPKTEEQSIAAWIAMSSRDSLTLPPKHELWQWYEVRTKLQLTQKQRLHIARFCLFNEVPVFYWLKGSPAELIKSMLMEALQERPPGAQVHYLLSVSAFLGKRFYASVVAQLGAYINKVPPSMRKYPPGGPRTLFRVDYIDRRKTRDFKSNETDLRLALHVELNQIVASVSKHKREEPCSTDRAQVQVIDCYLYAQDDQYKLTLPTTTQLDFSKVQKNQKSDIKEKPSQNPPILM